MCHLPRAGPSLLPPVSAAESGFEPSRGHSPNHWQGVLLPPRPLPPKLCVFFPPWLSSKDLGPALIGDVAFLCPSYCGCPPRSGENQDHLRGRGSACSDLPPLPLPQSLGSLVITIRGGCRGSVSDAPARYSRHCSCGRGAGDAAGMLTAGCPGLSAARGCCLESSGIAQPPPRELVSVGGREPLPHPDPLTGASGEGILEVGH